MVAKQIGARIQQYRKKKKLTQEQFAEQLNLSVGHVSSVERGVNMYSVDKLVEAMNLLECSADEIFIDVVDGCGRTKASILEDRLNALPKQERRRILDVVDALIRTAEKG